jgi:REP element-mobilizing transposase RayT
MARGNERRAIFRSEEDRKMFLETLGEAAERFGVVIHCYCLMPNHYHVALQTPRANLSKSVGWLQTTYTIRFNRRHQRCGHLFQGRFRAQLVEADEYAQHLVRYIHLNPVRLRNKNAAIPVEWKERLAGYLWSSHQEYLGKRETPPWLSLQWLIYWATNQKEAMRHYHEDIDQCFGGPIFDPMQDLRSGMVLGGENLWQKTCELVSAKRGQEEIVWKDGLRTEKTQDFLHSMLKDEFDLRIHIWARVRLGGHSPSHLAREYGFRHASGIWQVIHRLEIRSRQEQELQQKLEYFRKSVYA